MSAPRIAFAVLLAWPLTFVMAGSEARAATDGGTTADGGDELATVEKQLDDEAAALSTADCHDACRALASIQRAAERICNLEPGPRCTAARTKADEAARRVREACPDCAIASAPLRQVETAEVSRVPGSSNRPAPEESAPRGGCRSCTATGVATHSPDLAWIAGLVWVAARTRRKNRRTP